MKKNGKILMVLSAVSFLCYFAVTTNTKQKKHKASVFQYENRLKEFCIFDIEEAKEEFHSFLHMGFNPTDAFDLTVIKRVYI
jgi:hypothetical protein